MRGPSESWLGGEATSLQVDENWLGTSLVDLDRVCPFHLFVVHPDRLRDNATIPTNHTGYIASTTRSMYTYSVWDRY